MNILQSCGGNSFTISVLGKAQIMMQPVSLLLYCFEHGRVKKKVRNVNEERDFEMWSGVHTSSQKHPLEKYNLLYFMYLKLKRRAVPIAIVSMYYSISEIWVCPKV